MHLPLPKLLSAQLVNPAKSPPPQPTSRIPSTHFAAPHADEARRNNKPTEAPRAALTPETFHRDRRAGTVALAGIPLYSAETVEVLVTQEVPNVLHTALSVDSVATITTILASVYKAADPRDHLMVTNTIPTGQT